MKNIGIQMTDNILKNKDTLNNYLKESLANANADTFVDVIKSVFIPKNAEDAIARLRLVPAIGQIVKEGELGPKIDLLESINGCDIGTFNGISGITPIYASVSLEEKTINVGIFIFHYADGRNAHIFHPFKEEIFNIFIFGGK